MIVVRFADDTIVVFEHEQEASNPFGRASCFRQFG